MPILVTDNSQIQCSLGTTTAIIKVTSQSFKKINDSLIATEGDKEGITNIPSFGGCRRAWYRPSCKPNPIKWEGVAEKQALDGQKKLTKNSTCQCSFGGTISFIDTGANSFVDAE